MSIIDRYLFKEIFKHFFIVLAAAVGIYLVIDFFENIDKFMDAGLPVSRMIEFLQLKIPLIMVQITPVGILIAVLITFGLMNKNNEIIALKCGWSLKCHPFFYSHCAEMRRDEYILFHPADLRPWYFFYHISLFIIRNCGTAYHWQGQRHLSG